MNARFWIFVHDGFVKLTLRQGRPLRYWRAWDTDEGWSSVSEYFRLVDGVVLRDCSDDGRDCDGRMSSHVELACPVAALQSRDGFAVPLPRWDRVSESRRDYQAEAAGY